MKPFSKTVFRSRLCSSRSWVSRLDFDEVPCVANGLFHIFEANEPQKGMNIFLEIIGHGEDHNVPKPRH